MSLVSAGKQRDGRSESEEWMWKERKGRREGEAREGPGCSPDVEERKHVGEKWVITRSEK